MRNIDTPITKREAIASSSAFASAALIFSALGFPWNVLGVLLLMTSYLFAMLAPEKKP